MDTKPLKVSRYSSGLPFVVDLRESRLFAMESTMFTAVNSVGSEHNDNVLISTCSWLNRWIIEHQFCILTFCRKPHCFPAIWVKASKITQKHTCQNVRFTQSDSFYTLENII